MSLESKIIDVIQKYNICFSEIDYIDKCFFIRNGVTQRPYQGVKNNKNNAYFGIAGMSGGYVAHLNMNDTENTYYLLGFKCDFTKYNKLHIYGWLDSNIQNVLFVRDRFESETQTGYFASPRITTKKQEIVIDISKLFNEKYLILCIITNHTKANLYITNMWID